MFNKEITATMNKRQEIYKLAQKRDDPAYLIPRGYARIKSYHNGLHSSNQYVSPWTKGACNVDADVMVIGLDWNSQDMLMRQANDHVQIHAGQSKSFPTNKKLRGFLHAYCGLRFCDTYATDVVPFLKPGNATAPHTCWAVAQCARDFTIPEIMIIEPKIAICLGDLTFNAVLDAFYQYKGVQLLSLGTEDAYEVRYPSKHVLGTQAATEIYHVHHPGARKVYPSTISKWQAVSNACTRFGVGSLNNQQQYCPLHHHNVCRQSAGLCV
jgi:hypothetical protein